MFFWNVFYIYIFCWSLFFSYEAVFYKPTTLKVHPPFWRITAYATMPGYLPISFCFHALIQMNGAWCSTVGVWTHDLSVMSQPLDHGYLPLDV